MQARCKRVTYVRHSFETEWNFLRRAMREKRERHLWFRRNANLRTSRLARACDAPNCLDLVANSESVTCMDFFSPFSISFLELALFALLPPLHSPTLSRTISPSPFRDKQDKHLARVIHILYQQTISIPPAPLRPSDLIPISLSPAPTYILRPSKHKRSGGKKCPRHFPAKKQTDWRSLENMSRHFAVLWIVSWGGPSANTNVSKRCWNASCQYMHPALTTGKFDINTSSVVQILKKGTEEKHSKNVVSVWTLGHN